MAHAIGCDVDDEPEFHWHDRAPIDECAVFTARSIGCALPDNTIHVTLQPMRQDTLRIVTHEFVHWCFWRTGRDSDPDHKLAIWDNLGCRFAILPEQTY